MQPNQLVNHVTEFLSATPVKRLCRSYRTDPCDAQGELYFRLIHLASGKDIRKPADWVFRNGMGILRNWLRREVQTLV
jgi:hypothetical protein